MENQQESMPTKHKISPSPGNVHSWLRNISVAFVPSTMTPLLEEVGKNLLFRFEHLGHKIQTKPDANTDVILTTACFEETIDWRKALLLTARRSYQLEKSSIIFTLVHATPEAFKRVLGQLKLALDKHPANPSDFVFPGLAERAYHTLIEQGQRGGAILALERLVQAQTKCIRIVFLVGDEHPSEVYYFDLAGAYPRTKYHNTDTFYTDIALRIVTAASTVEVNQHQVVEKEVPRSLWQQMSTPTAMHIASQRFGERNFFTEMIRIADLVSVPAVGDAVASQYSEGCFATWEPKLRALVATVSGSARPIDKGNISDDDLAVIVGVRPDGMGALIQHVQGLCNDNPSTESVEMMEMDAALPNIKLGENWSVPVEVPVVRSKLHGHRGVTSYNPHHVEFVALDEPYYHYPVSCATDAQVRAIRSAFARSEALQNPNDAHQVVFTVLPGHGVVIVEKWVEGKTPFQIIWEYMDTGHLEIESLIPQGMMKFIPARKKMVLHQI